MPLFKLSHWSFTKRSQNLKKVRNTDVQTNMTDQLMLQTDEVLQNDIFNKRVIPLVCILKVLVARPVFYRKRVIKKIEKESFLQRGCPYFLFEYSKCFEATLFFVSILLWIRFGFWIPHTKDAVLLPKWAKFNWTDNISNYRILLLITYWLSLHK